MSNVTQNMDGSWNNGLPDAKIVRFSEEFEDRIIG